MVIYSTKEIVKTYANLGYLRETGITEDAEILFKIEGDKTKIVCIVNANPWFNRTTRFVRKSVDGLLRKYNFNVDEDDLLIIVRGRHSSYHFFGRNIIFINCKDAKPHYRTVSKSMIEEVRAMYEDRSIAMYEDKARHVYWQEYSRHIPVMIFLFMLLCIASYPVHRNMLYGYSAATVFGDNQAFRLISYIFMHGSIRHLVANMIALYYIGKSVEYIEGAFGTTVIFLGSGIFGAALDCLYKLYTNADINTITVGASGAIMGLLGAYTVEIFFDRDLETVKGQALLSVIITLVLSSIGGNIATGCHMFGFISGILLTLPIKMSNTNALEERDIYYNARVKHLKRRRYAKKDSYVGPAIHDHFAN